MSDFVLKNLQQQLINQNKQQAKFSGDIAKDKIKGESNGLSLGEYLKTVNDAYGNNISNVGGFYESGNEEAHRARYQSATDQFGNAIVKGIVSEIIGGTIGGVGTLAALPGALVSYIGNEPVTFDNWLTEIDDAIRGKMEENFPIYRKNPDKPLDWSDWAMYMDGLSSAMSTVGLLVPAMGATKLVTYGANVGKLLATGSKFGKKGLQITEGLLATGLMRYGENSKEAIPVYNQTYDYVYNKIKDLPKDELLEVLNSDEFTNYRVDVLGLEDGRKITNADLGIPDPNDPLAGVTISGSPQDKFETPLSKVNNKGKKILNNLTPETIAKYAASTSSLESFKLNAANFVFDAVQLLPIMALYNSGIASMLGKFGIESSKVLKEQMKTIGSTSKQIAKAVQMNRLKNAGLLFGGAVSEAPEETINAISEKEGMLYGKYLVSQNTKREYTDFGFRLSEYLKDPHVHEQAFHGLMGGLLFSGAASGVAKVSSELGHDGATKAKIQEINSRTIKIEDYKRKIKLLDSGIDPYHPQSNLKEGDENLNNAKFEYQYNNPEERAQAIADTKEYLLDELATNLGIEADRNGNTKMLMQQLDSSLFKESSINSGLVKKENFEGFKSDLKSRINEAIKHHSKIKSDMVKYGMPEEYANLLASKHTMNKRDLKKHQAKIDKLTKDIAELEDRDLFKEAINKEIDNPYNKDQKTNLSNLVDMYVLNELFNQLKDSFSKSNKNKKTNIFERNLKVIEKELTNRMKELSLSNEDKMFFSNNDYQRLEVTKRLTEVFKDENLAQQYVNKKFEKLLLEVNNKEITQRNDSYFTKAAADQAESDFKEAGKNLTNQIIDSHVEALNEILSTLELERNDTDASIKEKVDKAYSDYIESVKSDKEIDKNIKKKIIDRLSKDKPTIVSKYDQMLNNKHKETINNIEKHKKLVNNLLSRLIKDYNNIESFATRIYTLYKIRTILDDYLKSFLLTEQDVDSDTLVQVKTILSNDNSTFQDNNKEYQEQTKNLVDNELILQKLEEVHNNEIHKYSLDELKLIVTEVENLMSETKLQTALNGIKNIIKDVYFEAIGANKPTFEQSKTTEETTEESKTTDNEPKRSKVLDKVETDLKDKISKAIELIKLYAESQNVDSLSRVEFIEYLYRYLVLNNKLSLEQLTSSKTNELFKSVFKEIQVENKKSKEDKKFKKVVLNGNLSNATIIKRLLESNDKVVPLEYESTPIDDLMPSGMSLSLFSNDAFIFEKDKDGNYTGTVTIKDEYREAYIKLLNVKKNDKITFKIDKDHSATNSKIEAQDLGNVPIAAYIGDTKIANIPYNDSINEQLEFVQQFLSDESLMEISLIYDQLVSHKGMSNEKLTDEIISILYGGTSEAHDIIAKLFGIDQDQEIINSENPEYKEKLIKDTLTKYRKFLNITVRQTQDYTFYTSEKQEPALAYKLITVDKLKTEIYGTWLNQLLIDKKISNDIRSVIGLDRTATVLQNITDIGSGDIIYNGVERNLEEFGKIEDIVIMDVVPNTNGTMLEDKEGRVNTLPKEFIKQTGFQRAGLGYFSIKVAGKNAKGQQIIVPGFLNTSNVLNDNTSDAQFSTLVELINNLVEEKFKVLNNKKSPDTNNFNELFDKLSSIIYNTNKKENAINEQGVVFSFNFYANGTKYHASIKQSTKSGWTLGITRNDGKKDIRVNPKEIYETGDYNNKLYVVNTNKDILPLLKTILQSTRHRVNYKLLKEYSNKNYVDPLTGKSYLSYKHYLIKNNIITTNHGVVKDSKGKTIGFVTPKTSNTHPGIGRPLKIKTDYDLLAGFKQQTLEELKKDITSIKMFNTDQIKSIFDIAIRDGVKVVYSSELTDREGGYATYQNNIVTLYAGLLHSPDAIRLNLIHELLHHNIKHRLIGLTLEKRSEFENDLIKYNKNLIKQYQTQKDTLKLTNREREQVEAILKELQNDKNAEEVITYFFTNRSFNKALKQLKSDETKTSESFWSKLANLFNELIELVTGTKANELVVLLDKHFKINEDLKVENKPIPKVTDDLQNANDEVTGTKKEEESIGEFFENNGLDINKEDEPKQSKVVELFNNKSIIYYQNNTEQSKVIDTEFSSSKLTDVIPGLNILSVNHTIDVLSTFVINNVLKEHTQSALEKGLNLNLSFLIKQEFANLAKSKGLLSNKTYLPYYKSVFADLDSPNGKLWQMTKTRLSAKGMFIKEDENVDKTLQRVDQEVTLTIRPQNKISQVVKKLIYQTERVALNKETNQLEPVINQYSGLPEYLTDIDLNTILEVLLPATSVVDMMNLLRASSKIDPSYLTIYNKLKEDEELQNLFYANFNKQKPDTFGTRVSSNEVTATVNDYISNKDTKPEYRISNDWKRALILKLQSVIKTNTHSDFITEVEEILRSIKFETGSKVTHKKVNDVLEKLSEAYSKLNIYITPDDIRGILDISEIREEYNTNVDENVALSLDMIILLQRIKPTIDNLVNFSKSYVNNQFSKFDQLGSILKLAKDYSKNKKKVEHNYLSAYGTTNYSIINNTFLGKFFKLIHSNTEEGRAEAFDYLSKIATNPALQYENILWNDETPGLLNYIESKVIINGVETVYKKPISLNIELAKEFDKITFEGTNTIETSDSNRYRQLSKDDFDILSLLHFLQLSTDNINSFVKTQNKPNLTLFSPAFPSDKTTYSYHKAHKIPITGISIKKGVVSIDRNSVMGKKLFDIFLQYNARVLSNIDLIFDKDKNGNYTQVKESALTGKVYLDEEQNEYYLLGENTHFKNVDSNNNIIFSLNSRAELNNTFTPDMQLTGNVFTKHPFASNYLKDNNFPVTPYQLVVEGYKKHEDKIWKHIEDFILAEYTKHFNLFANKPSINKLNIDSLSNAVLDYQVNSFIYNNTVQNIFLGNTFEYKNELDVNKRAFQGQSPVTYAATEKGRTFRATTIKDISIPSDNVSQLLATVLKIYHKRTGSKLPSKSSISKLEQAILKGEYPNIEQEKPIVRYAWRVLQAYGKIDITDGQSYITLDEFERRSKMFGINEEYRELIHKLKTEPENITLSEYAKLLQPQKNFYYNRELKPIGYIELEDGSKQAIYDFKSQQIKNSEFIIIPSLLEEGSRMKKLHDAMTNNDIVQINFKSSEKVGNTYSLSVFENNELVDDFEQRLVNTSKVYQYEYLGIQQELPSDVQDHSNKLGVQFAKLIHNNLNKTDSVYEINGIKYTGNEIMQMYFDSYVSNIKSSVFGVLDKLDVSFNLLKFINDPSSVEFEDLKPDIHKVTEVLKNYADIKGLSIYDIDGLSIPEGSNNPNIPIFMSSIANKWQEVLTNIFTREVIDQRIPGPHAIQTSQAAFQLSGLNENKLLTVIRDELKTKPNRKLKSAYWDSNGVYHPDEILLPAWTKQIIANRLKVNIDQLDEQQLNNLIGYRIPTEDKHSMSLFKVVGFLDDVQGSTVVVPDDFIVRSGSDFDIDTIYFISPNMEYNNETGKLEKVKFLDGDNTLEERYNNFIYRYINKDTLKQVNQLSELELDRLKKSKFKLYTSFNRVFKNEGNELKVALKKQLNEEITSIEEELNNSFAIGYKLFKLLPISVQNEYYNISDKLEAEGKKGIFKTEAFLSISQFKLEDSTTPEEDKKILSELIDLYSYQLELQGLKQKNINDYKNSISEYYSSRVKAIEDLKYEQAELDKEFKTKKLNLLRALDNLPTIDEFKKLSLADQNTKEANDNRIIDIYTSILSSEEHANEFITPNFFDDIASIAEELNEQQGALNPLSQADQLLLRDRAMAAVTLKAISVNVSNFISLAQFLDVKLHPNFHFNILESGVAEIETENDENGQVLLDFDKVGETLPVGIFGKKDIAANKNLITFDQLGKFNGTNFNNSGESILTYGSQAVSNSFDAVKSPFPPNVNEETIVAWMLLPHMGSTWAFSSLLVNTEYFKSFAKHKKGSVIGDPKLSTYAAKLKAFGESSAIAQELRLNQIEISELTVIENQKFKSNGISEDDLRFFLNPTFRSENKEDLIKDLKRHRYIELQVRDIASRLIDLADVVNAAVFALSVDRISIGPNLFKIEQLNQRIRRFDAIHAMTEQEYADYSNLIGSERNKNYSLAGHNTVAKYEPNLFDNKYPALYVLDENNKKSTITKAIYKDNKYPPFKAYYDYGFTLANSVLKNLFVNSIPGYNDYHNLLSDIGATDKVHREFDNYIVKLLMSESEYFKDLDSESGYEERQRLLGIGKFNDDNLIVYDFDFNDKSLDNIIKFEELTLINKIDLIKTSPYFAKYRQDMGENDIFSYLDTDSAEYLYQRFNYKPIRYISNNNVILQDMFGILFTNNNPFLRNIAHDIVKYSYLTNGLAFGFNLTKLIPANLYYKDYDSTAKIPEGIGITKAMYAKIKDFELTDDIFIGFLQQHSEILPTLTKTFSDPFNQTKGNVKRELPYGAFSLIQKAKVKIGNRNLRIDNTIGVFKVVNKVNKPVYIKSNDAYDKLNNSQYTYLILNKGYKGLRKISISNKNKNQTKYSVLNIDLSKSTTYNKFKALRDSYVYDIENDSIHELKSDSSVKGIKDTLSVSNYELLLEDKLNGYINYSHSKYDSYRKEYFGDNAKLYTDKTLLDNAFGEDRKGTGVFVKLSKPDNIEYSKSPIQYNKADLYLGVNERYKTKNGNIVEELIAYPIGKKLPFETSEKSVVVEFNEPSLNFIRKSILKQLDNESVKQSKVIDIDFSSVKDKDLFQEKVNFIQETRIKLEKQSKFNKRAENPNKDLNALFDSITTLEANDLIIGFTTIRDYYKQELVELKEILNKYLAADLNNVLDDGIEQSLFNDSILRADRFLRSLEYIKTLTYDSNIESKSPTREEVELNLLTKEINEIKVEAQGLNNTIKKLRDRNFEATVDTYTTNPELKAKFKSIHDAISDETSIQYYMNPIFDTHVPLVANMIKKYRIKMNIARYEYIKEQNEWRDLIKKYNLKTKEDFEKYLDEDNTGKKLPKLILKYKDDFRDVIYDYKLHLKQAYNLHNTRASEEYLKIKREYERWERDHVSSKNSDELLKALNDLEDILDLSNPIGLKAAIIHENYKEKRAQVLSKVGWDRKKLNDSDTNTLNQIELEYALASSSTNYFNPADNKTKEEIEIANLLNLYNNEEIKFRKKYYGSEIDFDAFNEAKDKALSRGDNAYFSKWLSDNSTTAFKDEFWNNLVEYSAMLRKNKTTYKEFINKIRKIIRDKNGAPDGSKLRNLDEIKNILKIESLERSSKSFIPKAFIKPIGKIYTDKYYQLLHSIASQKQQNLTQVGKIRQNAVDTLHKYLLDRKLMNTDNGMLLVDKISFTDIKKIQGFISDFELAGNLYDKNNRYRGDDFLEQEILNKTGTSYGNWYGKNHKVEINREAFEDSKKKAEVQASKLSKAGELDYLSNWNEVFTKDKIDGDVLKSFYSAFSNLSTGKKSSVTASLLIDHYLKPKRNKNNNISKSDITNEVLKKIKQIIKEANDKDKARFDSYESNKGKTFVPKFAYLSDYKNYTLEEYESLLLLAKSNYKVFLKDRVDPFSIMSYQPTNEYLLTVVQQLNVSDELKQKIESFDIDKDDGIKLFEAIFKDHSQDTWFKENHLITGQGIIPIHVYSKLEPVDKSKIERNAPKELFFGDVEVTNKDYIDQEKTDAAKWLRENVTYEETIYYKKVKEEVERTNKYQVSYLNENEEVKNKNLTYAEWFLNNHYYDPYVGKYVPISIWTNVSAVNPDYVLEYYPNNTWKSYSVKNDYVNKEYKTDAYDNPVPRDKKLNGEQSEFVNEKYDLVKDDEVYKAIYNHIMTGSRIYGRSSILDKGYLPSEAVNSDNNILAKIGFYKKPEAFKVEGDNETIRFLDFPFINMISTQDQIKYSKRKKDESFEDYEKRVVKELKEAGSTKQDGSDINSLDELYEENKIRYSERKEEHIKNTSYDVANLIEKFIKGYTEFKYKKQLESELLNTIREVSESDFIKKNTKLERAIDNVRQRITGEQFAKGEKPNSNVEQHFLKWMKMIFYNEPEIDEGNWTKVARVLQNVTSAQGMWFNVTGAFNNVVYGNTQIAMETAAKEFWTRNEAWKADRDYFANVFQLLNKPEDNSYTNKLVALVHFADILQLQDERDNYKDYEIKNKTFRFLMDTDKYYAFHHMGEHFMQNKALIAMLYSHKLHNGKIVSFNDYKGHLNYQTAIDLLSNISLNKAEELKQYVVKMQKKLDKTEKYNINDYVIMYLQNNEISVLKEYNRLMKERNKKLKVEFDALESVESGFELDPNGRIKLLEDKLSTKEWGAFREKVIGVNHKIHGIYNHIDKNTIQESALGRLALQFRKFAKPGWDKRYGTRTGKVSWSERLESWNRGAYVDTFRFLTKPFLYNKLNKQMMKEGDQEFINASAFANGLIKGYINYISNIRVYYNSLTDSEKASIRRTTREMLLFTMALTVIPFVLMALKDEEDKDMSFVGAFTDKDQFLQWMLYQQDRIWTELGFYTPYGAFNEGRKLFKTPFAGLTAIERTSKLLVELLMYYPSDEEDRYYKGGIYNNESKVKVQLIKSIPVYNQLDFKFRRLNKYYKLY